MSAFIRMQIASWLPKGCYIATHHFWPPEMLELQGVREKGKKKHQEILAYISFANANTWLLLTSGKTRKINVCLFFAILIASLIETEEIERGWKWKVSQLRVSVAKEKKKEYLLLLSPIKRGLGH